LIELKKEVFDIYNDFEINLQQVQQNIAKGQKQIEDEIRESNEKADRNNRQFSNILNMRRDKSSSSLKYSKEIKAIVIEVRNLQESILTETYGVKNQIFIQRQAINENFNVSQENLIQIYSKQEMAD
jgi:regulator of replication initiation timing